MVRRWSALWLIFLLCGCASSSKETDSSLAAAIGCMRQKAPILDDHTSSATSVGYGLTGACGTEIATAIDVATNGIPLASYARAKAQMQETMLKSATEIVLEERAGH